MSDEYDGLEDEDVFVEEEIDHGLHFWGLTREPGARFHNAFVRRGTAEYDVVQIEYEIPIRPCHR